MVKAKELKRLRKAIDQAERLVPDPLPLLELPGPAFTATFYKGPLPPALLEECLALFQQNMQSYHTHDADTYMDEKLSELTHRSARFIVVHPADDEKSLAAFLHYRFCLDDDDDPTAVVVYLYELQVHHYRRCGGLGRALTRTTVAIARQAHVPSVMLTVHKTNAAARTLYTALGFTMDASSPSQHGDFSVDYEILSLSMDEQQRDTVEQK